MPWYCCAAGTGIGTCVAGSDANNDENKVEHVLFSKMEEGAIRIGHSQSVVNSFTNNSCAGGAVAEWCVYANNGSFRWTGGFTGNNNQADFHIETPGGHGYVIENTNSEDSDRFLNTGGPNKTFDSVIISGNRWSNSGLNADGRAIRFQLAGPLIVMGNDFGGTDVSMTFWLNGNGPQTEPVSRAIAFGNYIRSTAANIFTTQHTTWERWETFGNVQRTGASAWQEAVDQHELPNGATPPTTCNVGDVFLDTDSPVTLYNCSATNSWTGIAAATATALAADPTDCSTNQFANAIAASGNLTCAQPAFTDLAGAATDAQVPNTITIDLATAATALAADPAACTTSPQLYATDIAPNGTLTCAQVAYSQLTGAPTVAPTDASYVTTASNATLSGREAPDRGHGHRCRRHRHRRRGRDDQLGCERNDEHHVRRRHAGLHRVDLGDDSQPRPADHDCLGIHHQDELAAR